jgi:hypothetical protein
MSNFAEKLVVKLRFMHKDILRDYALIILVASILVLIWFRKNTIIASGEFGFFDLLERTRYDVVWYTWWNDGMGNTWPHILAMAPLYSFVALLKWFGLSNVVIQVIIFFLVLALNGLSVYYLTTQLIEGSIKRLAGLFSGLFYMLNPYALYVWNRFSQIMLAPLLPLMLILYIKGLEEQKMHYAFYICLVSLAFNYALANIPNIVTIWVPLFSYFIFHVLSSRKSEIFYAFKFSILTICLWFLLNAWWFLQFICSCEYAIAKLTTPLENLGHLLGISKHLSLVYVTRLIFSPFYFSEGLKPIYSSFIFEGISLLIPIIVFSSVPFKPKHKYVWYFLCLSLLGLFLAKGAAPPFGEVFVWFFIQFFVLGMFRNPFEKLGVILPLAYAFLFGIGLSSWYYWIRDRMHISSVVYNVRVNLKKTIAGTLVLLISFSIFGVYLWPMWTGDLFPSIDHPKVPLYYQEANAWLSQQPGDFKVISFPLDGIGMTYNWTNNYAGIEPSFTLFNKPFISRTTFTFPYVDDIILRMPATLYRTDKVWKIMALLNAKYIVVNRDVDYRARGLESPEDAKRQLTNAIIPENNGDYVTSCETATGWKNDGPTKVLVDNTFYSRGKGSIKFSFSNATGEYGATYTLSSAANWTRVKFIGFWLRTNCLAYVKAFELRIQSKNGFWILYILPPATLNKWTRYIIPMNLFLAQAFVSGSPTLDSISGISLHLGRIDRLYTGDIWIDEIKTYEGMQKIQQHILFDRTFGNLDFYRVDDKYFLEHIYATNQFLFSEDVNTMFFDIENDFFTPGNTILFLISQSNINDVSFLESLKVNNLYKPKITFEKIDPTRYIVHVANASQPFFLVFSESYHPQWAASINNKQIPDRYHFIVNGYANAWYVNETGSFDVIIEFLPQKLVYTGSIITLVTLTFCLVYFAKDRIKTIYYRYVRKIGLIPN